MEQDINRYNFEDNNDEEFDINLPGIDDNNMIEDYIG